jgi:hypothetical protein
MCSLMKMGMSWTTGENTTTNYKRSTVTKTAALLPAPSTAVMKEGSVCKTIPGAAITLVNALGPASINDALCPVCTRYAVNATDCTTIPNCLP